MTRGGGTTNLTQAQTLIWAGQQLHPSDPLYNMVHAFRIRGPVDDGVFAAAFKHVVEGTDALRTVFTADTGVPRRVVLDDEPQPLRIVDFSAETDIEAAYAAWSETEAKALLDLTRCLYRSTLIRLGPEDFVWYIVQHHLITDGWATAILYQRMEESYRTLASGASVGDGYPSFEFYAGYEQNFRESDEFRTAESYWAAQAAQPLPTPSFYGETPQPGGMTRTDRVTRHLGVERTHSIAAVAADVTGGSVLGGVSQFTIFAAALFAWLGRVTGETELAILAPAHNRPSKTFKNTVGLFMEVLPLHVSLEDDETFRSLIGKVATATRQLLLHAQPGTSSATHNRAYSVLLNFINASFGDFNGWHMESDWVHPGHGDSDHSLRLQVHDFDATGEYQLHFDLSSEVFDEPGEQRIVRHFVAMLDALLADVDQPIASVDLLTEAEHAAVEAFCGPAEPAPYASLLEPFAEMVDTYPDEIAVAASELTMSYAELDAASDNVARSVRAHTGEGEPTVIVFMRRSAELVAALLGVFKAGGSYVPVDVHYPSDRVAHLIADSGADLVLTSQDLEAAVPPGGTVVALPLDSEPAIDTTLPGAGRTAYVMYTSGSTGTPKGVVVSHESLIDYVWWARTIHGGDEPVSFPLYSSIGFDLTVTSLFVPLVSGGRIVVYPEPDEGADLAIVDVFADDAVDVVKLTPSHLAVLDVAALRTERIRSLILGGEDFKTSQAAAVDGAGDHRLAIYNEYGPTEATVGCMLHRYDRERDIAQSVPIGRPAPNTTISVLDRHGMPVPVGVVGEIWVGGTGVADGYLGRPDLTRERFVDDPDRPGHLRYWTGDLARWVEPGVIEFLGRSDDQVKVRGHRIELGEVESFVKAVDGVADAVVDIFETEAVRIAGAVDAVQCERCGLAADHPEAHLDDAGVCVPCRFYEEHRTTAEAYFGTMDDFRAILAGASSTNGDADCLMLLSGGKDSTYALYQLVENGLTPLVFSLDNGFVSEGAKANIQRAVDDLGLELVWGTTPAMNDIFADSLGTFSNVCQGCFKTIYTLATNLAHQRGLRFMVTGLSRGQIFETRLADLFRIGITDPADVDRAVIEARRAYHHVDDAVARLLDTEIFDDPTIFDDIEIVDFYRYCDVGLDELYTFLDEKAPWVRPKDTGRSTNCLINNTGIFVHKTEQGFHNYALPYSWDVRLGHKTKAAALAELDDEIDMTQVRDVLAEVGYELDGAEADGLRTVETRLAAYYVADDAMSPQDLRSALSSRLPDPMVPSYLVPIDAMPLTINGKVDRAALPDPRRAVRSGEAYVAPRTDIERQLADIWQSVLGVDNIGVHDPFIELGGDSILNIQIVAKAKANGLEISSRQLFDHPTIAQLARVALEVHGTADMMIPTPVADGFGPEAFPEAGLSQEELDSLLASFGEDERA